MTLRAAGAGITRGGPVPDGWLAVVSGVLLFVSFPPIGLAVAPFVALVPLTWYVAMREDGAAGRWQAGRAGLVTGLVGHGLLMHWLVPALWPDPWAVPAFLVVVTVLAAFPAAVAWSLHWVRGRVPVPIWLATALLWTAAEWVQGHSWGLSFPWLGLGTALGSHPTLAGAAELAGARGLTFWVAAVNGLAVTVLLHAGRPRTVAVAALAGTVALPATFGAWRARTLESRLEPAARVAVVQTVLDRDGLEHGTGARAWDALRRLTGQVGAGSADLIVWPEAAVRAVLDDPVEAFRLAELQRLSDEAGAPILVGGYARGAAATGATDPASTAPASTSRRPPAPRPLHNAAVLVDGSGVRGVHLKRHLVPFIERVPRLYPARLAPLPGNPRFYGGLAPGPPARPLDGGVAVHGVLICFESVFGGSTRAQRALGARFFVNPTNDAWFSGERAGASIGHWQHALHLRLRAIETRAGIARAANQGFSHFVDPLGRVYGHVPSVEAGTAVATVSTIDVETLYVRWGDWLGLAAAVATAILVAAAAASPSTARPPAGPRVAGA